MYKIRTTQTGSGNTAVQIVTRERSQTRVIKHLGSAKNPGELADLKRLASQYLILKSETPPLFPQLFTASDSNQRIVKVGQLQVRQITHQAAYDFLSEVYRNLGFAKLPSHPLFADLVLMRLIEPASKIRTLTLLKRYFGKIYSENLLYRQLPGFLSLKSQACQIAVNYARNKLAFNFSLVFYDVTTLYFETFTADELRKPGFSKDNKANQPQILIGLVVNAEGFPVAFDIFEGNTFEGKTILPVIKSLQKQWSISDLTVVADSAMLSQAVMNQLTGLGLHYIVGARLANLPLSEINSISKHLGRQEGKYYAALTDRGLLVCDYSAARASKDKSDRQKQIDRANRYLARPGSGSRLRFVKSSKPNGFELNQPLISKSETLEGIKGYYTDSVSLPPELIVARYKDLWQIEKSFRLAKSDLEARPIWHRKKANIETHILIVFVSLCLAKVIELAAHTSIRKIIDMVWDIQDVELEDTLTGEKHIKRSEGDLATFTKLADILGSLSRTY